MSKPSFIRAISDTVTIRKLLRAARRVAFIAIAEPIVAFPMLVCGPGENAFVVWIASGVLALWAFLEGRQVISAINTILDVERRNSNAAPQPPSKEQ